MDARESVQGQREALGLILGGGQEKESRAEPPNNGMQGQETSIIFFFINLLKRSPT